MSYERGHTNKAAGLAPASRLTGGVPENARDPLPAEAQLALVKLLTEPSAPTHAMRALRSLPDLAVRPRR
jgi:hypothetical protein